MKMELATHKDVNDLVALVNSAYRGDRSRKGWTTEADFLEGIRVNENSLTSLIDTDESFVFKCLDDDENIVGSVHFQIQDDSLYLGMLTVQPELQGNGIGKTILSFAGFG